MVRAEERRRDNRLKERGAGKLFAGLSDVMLSARLRVEILWSVGWKEKALRQRLHRLAEQQIQSRANTVGLSWYFDFDPLVLILPTARAEGCSQPLDQSRHRGKTA
jgi:hypothetical protein